MHSCACRVWWWRHSFAIQHQGLQTGINTERALAVRFTCNLRLTAGQMLWQLHCS